MQTSTYNEEKATAVACFFLERAGGKLEDLKLMKLMYLAEREALRIRSCSIIGDAYYSMKNGPVLSATLDRMTPRDQIDPQGIWREHIDLPEKWKIRLKRLYPVHKSLSNGELEILDQVWAQYGNMTKWELRDLTHDLPEWHDPAGSSGPISLDEIYAAFGLDAHAVEARLSAHRADDTMSQLLREAGTM
jgi:uncharacterized phage-associated protein